MAKEKASKTTRTIPADTMAFVMEFSPRDPFEITEKMLGETFVVTGVNKTDFGGRPSVIMVLENESQTINMPLSVLKKSRIIKSSTATLGTKWGNSQRVALKSNAEEMWSNSQFFHEVQGMKKDDSFVIPDTLTFEYAIISEDRATPGVAKYNPFGYKGWRKVVDKYSPKYPTMDDFIAEHQKVGADRIQGLPEGTKPELLPYIKGELRDLTSTLILKDTFAKNE